MEDMKNWIDFAKNQKNWAVEATDRGDIPPTVIVERNGETLAVVIAPQIDKMLGLSAALMCRVGFDPDALTFVVDAHMHLASSKKDQSLEEAEKEFRSKYPKGMQHACDNEQACATGEITDCLICHRITRDGQITLVTIPYSYHGKEGGVPFKWLDEDEKYKEFGKETSENIQGFIPDELRKIMKQPCALEKVPELKELSEKVKFSDERVRFHTARAMISVLTSQKYMVADFVSGTHPEWTEAKSHGNTILSKMISNGTLAKESFSAIKEIIDDHIGTNVFVEKMQSLLKANSFWLSSQIRQNIPSFVQEFQSFCMSPPVIGDDEEDKKFEPKRVKVWSGDKSELLGEGNYVGDVSIYVVEMEDGSLLSRENAEIEPDNVPEGGKVKKIKNNPKIVLDNGETVYGCQVWWEEIKKQKFGGWNSAKPRT